MRSVGVDDGVVSVKLYVLTCASRVDGGVTQSTLDSIARSDWTEPVELVIQDDDITGDPCDCQTENYRRLLERVVADASDYALIVEDDIHINRYVKFNLTHWLAKLGNPADFLGSLYNPNIRPLPGTGKIANGFVADPEAVYGSQAFILSVPVAMHCLREWRSMEGMQDIKVSRHSARMPGVQIVYHRPSLVQHNVTASSTHGGVTHCAVDFDPWWHAGRAHPASAPGQSWERIRGWFDWAKFYDARVRELQHGDTIVEIGSFLGRSIIYLAQAMQAKGKDLRLVAVDTFVGYESDPMVLEAVAREGDSLFATFEANLCACNVQDCIEVMAMDSVGAAERFSDRSVDVVFVDGDHSYAGVTADITAWLPKIRCGGYLAGHDIDTFATVGQAVADVLGRSDVWIDHSQNLWGFQCTLEAIHRANGILPNGFDSVSNQLISPCSLEPARQ